MPKKMHLMWFFGFAIRDWKESGAGYDFRYPELYQHAARACERAKFDLMTFADILAVSTAYQGKMDTHLRYGVYSDYLDPVPLTAMLAGVTERLGFAATLSTTYYPPYLLARLMATLDHLTRGRIGWNVVTSASPEEAANFGYHEMLDHDERYERADEYMELCYRLWSSWETDALVLDRERDIFADPARVHAINFEGKYFHSRGPLNVVPSPQGRPTILQAGSSPRGKDFAAKHAEAIIVMKNTLDDMKEFYDDVKGRMRKFGRDPDDCKIFFALNPIIADTEDAALQRRARIQENAPLEAGLAYVSNALAVDLSQFNLDEPLPRMEIRGTQGKQAQYYAHGRQPTIREMAKHTAMHETYPIWGTPEQVADELQRIMKSVGGDGIAIRSGFTPSTVIDFVDGVVPILQRRGLARTEYSGLTLREHLMEF